MEEKWTCNYVHNQRGNFLVLNLNNVNKIFGILSSIENMKVDNVGEVTVV